MKYSSIFSVVASLVFSPGVVLAEGHSVSVQGPDGSSRKFSLETLDNLPQTSFETSTIWTDGVVAFSGVSLSAILDEAGFSGAIVRMSALNDYSVDFPMAEIGKDYPIVATRMNGTEMPVRDKGPYWMVFPYDADPSYRTKTAYARSVWQLSKLLVIK
ncbi:Oxidoreductase molybdopterin binding domain protein [Shimia sp. SK013]|uniref:molybdopterin-dependent oxidoreductase n=1 Tax=Shimia sp. SK013 TaxID=1389006 RepID=UPI0006B62ECA|nr:molybdopterin-dependent oxidoreductase [Shimia sp. SK013]KPA22589.1 Oxidoreductase molybdopterin binding domain protein [Shimia sp. SK013]